MLGEFVLFNPIIAKKHDTEDYNEVLFVVHKKWLSVITFQTYVLPDSLSAYDQGLGPFELCR